MPIIRTGGVKIEKESKSESKLTPLATIIGGLAVILVAFIAARDSFPAYLFYVVVIFLLIIIVSFLIYGFLAHPIYDFIKKRRETRRLNALAKKHFNEFKNFTDTFGELVDSSRSNNIPQALKALYSSQEFRNISCLSTQDLYNLFNYFEERLKRFDGTKEDFSLLVNEFDSILEIYNKHCIYNPVREIRRIGRNKVNEDIKEDYNKKKGWYELFLRNYMGFGKKLNKEFGERIFREYFEMPGEL